MLSEFCPDICPWADIAVGLQCLRMGKIDVITYKYVIILVYSNYLCSNYVIVAVYLYCKSLCT